MRVRVIFIAAAAIAVTAGVAACPPSGAPRPFTPSPTPTTGWDHGAPTVKLPDGGRCTTATDCVSGMCEGEGCGAESGTCVSAQRACTKDLREYCGCEGVTFQASGSCPSQRFAHTGACKQPDGNACQAGTDCASGVCEGLGCGAATPGVCVGADRVCAQVVTQFCGCDGTTLRSGSSCAGQRYAAAGACAPPAPRADGAACLAATECKSGVCEGQGCGADVPGACAPARRGCTRDRRPYCGCDGATFYSSGSCAGQRYSAKSACAGS